MAEGSLIFCFEAAKIKKLSDAITYNYDYVLITAGPEFIHTLASHLQLTVQVL